MPTPLGILQNLVIALESKDVKAIRASVNDAKEILGDRIKIVTMYNEGSNYTQIAEALGINKGSISRILKEAGINPEGRGKQQVES